MKKKYIALNLLLSAVACLTPISIYYSTILGMPNIYEKTYYAALVDKLELLKNTKGKKLVLIGGSNVAFGFDGKTLKEEYFKDYEIVNFGLYAALGTKIMMDLAKPYLKDGDIALIAPEINEQSMSLYFSGTETWKAIETEKNIYWSIPTDNRETLRGSLLEFAREKKKYNEPIVPKDVYQRSSFNEFGDIKYGEELEGQWASKRDKNILALHYDPSMTVNYKISMDNDFANYLNDYYKDLRKIGCTVYYGFSPVNDLSITSTEPAFTSLYWDIRNKLNMNIIGSPEEYVLDSHYFYDSNFHLNDAGSIFRSLLFIEHYARDVKGEYLTLKEKYPDRPEYETINIDTSINSETADCFTYTLNGNYLEISGVAEKGRNLKTVILPAVANHSLVTGISKNAFSNSEIETLTIPATISYIKDGAFGDSLIEAIYMESSDPSSTNVSYDGSLVNGVKDDFAIYVPSDSFGDYSSNYYWGAYSQYLRRY